MRPGQASKTAALVCMGRALADRDPASSFSDPTAFALLPDESQRRVEWVLSGEKPKGMRETIERGYFVRQSKIMVARTVAIDDAVREAAHSQVVILGAGLDGRAWRLPELANAVVFEVDHPDSQRDKRARVEPLKQTAREVRFVAVDFTRDDLGDSLERAGHDPKLPTTWIWEGVVMYLSRADIEATLAVVARRSPRGSRLVVLYHAPAFILHIVGFIVRRVGEPLRSSFKADAMRALLAKHGFDVVRDRNMAEIGASMSAVMGQATKPTSHLRIAIADRSISSA